jgi:hypothetical protein
MKTENGHLSARQKAELKLIAALTLEATLSAEEKLSKLADKASKLRH